jgi:hypothetical protein
MKDLTAELQTVYNTSDLTEKKEAMYKLINASHAKALTKKQAIATVAKMTTSVMIDKFATNYMFSGEGMKV